ncbi:MAG: hypothetical protein DID92_2727743525 [Candidatus Nitrotoga sp. SPKER]|nr:MAG: hypothetical protein DID92_2727743525 [Candidatus Nitrotoga sp. SPKER]
MCGLQIIPLAIQFNRSQKRGSIFLKLIYQVAP